MAAHLPTTLAGDQPGGFLGSPLAPGLQAVLRHLRGEAGRAVFRTGRGRARRVLRFGHHARLWRVGRGTRDRALLRHVLLRHDGRRLHPRRGLEGEDGLEGAGAVGLAVGYGVDVLLGQLDRGCVGEKGIDHQ